jgi:peptide/nickel transport system permease protein
MYEPDKSVRYPLRFFVRGPEYELLGLIPGNVHLFGTGEWPVFLFGTDKLGRDMLTRLLFAGRISLSLGLVGVFLSFILGCILGGISGYYGGSVDMAIQRIIEFLLSIPTIPLWMGLSAALPPDWSPEKV